MWNANEMRNKLNVNKLTLTIYLIGITKNYILIKQKEVSILEMDVLCRWI